jgi:signal transduction histidine kinase
MVSHDLRNPLNSLKLILYSLERTSGGEEARFQRPLELARRQIARMLNLVNRLLEPIKTEGAIEKPQLEEFDLAELVREVVEDAEPEITAASCLLKLDMGPVKGLWDRFDLQRVLTYLLSNASKYAPGSTIIIRLRAEPGVARMSIQDDGPGIDPDQHEMIFRRFVTAGSSHAKRESLGLGLYIARRIVEAHGGVIEVESEVGKGTTFIMTLPTKTVTVPLWPLVHG